jgi:hypothetical protein
MGLDIRLPIGLLFACLGGLLVLYGLVSSPAIYERSLGINVNLWWGLVMLAFGAVMTLAGWRGGKSAPQQPSNTTEPPRGGH